MPNQILTQEEIDALLSAMERSDVDLEQETKKDVEAVPYNLASHNIMLRDQFSALEEVYDKFATQVRDSLSSSLQRSIGVKFVSAEVTKYRDFLSDYSSPTSFNIFSMDPLIGSALLAIKPDLVFSLIDCMFGGDGKPTTQIREFTQIEQRMIRKVTLDLLKKLEKAWSIVYSIKISLEKTETKPEFVHLVPPSDTTVVIIFAIEGKEFSGNIKLCIPYLMLEPIKEKLSPKYMREKERKHTWGAQLKELLKDTHVTIIAELGRANLSVRDLLNLQVEDVLKLNTGPEDLINICIDQIPKYLGYPGIIKGNRAVEVTRLLNKNGGDN